ncbi:MAG: hypothetical protein II119_02710 [Bacilli bacterium]|nr:hypothetical protein [Bacilli bacterium]MBQ6282544.1 hypothetical protein [Bacilli bacterium]
MDREIKTEYVDKLLSLTKEELEGIFNELSLSELEDLISKINEGVE